MRLVPLVLAAVTCAGPLLAQGGGTSFASSLPEEIGDVTGWQIVNGEFETTEARGAYMFYVNPARSAMYQLMRYHLESTAAGSRLSLARGAGERVAFVRRPGVREPIECWEKQAPGARPAWRRIGAGTEEYKIEMAALMYVLGVHRAVRSRE